MTPRRDVEGEIYAQLYGEPSEPADPGATRVIDGDHRTRPVREDPEPEPPRPRAFEALGLAAAAAGRSVKEALRSTRAQGQRDAVRSTRGQARRDAVRSTPPPGELDAARASRTQSLRDAAHSARVRAADGLGGREHWLALGALAVALIGLVLIAGLIAGSENERQRLAGPPPGSTANQLAADREAREAREEAREARRRRARRKRAAAQRRAEQNAIASADHAHPDYSPRAPRQRQATRGVCSEDAGCDAPQTSHAARQTRDDDDAEQSVRDTAVRRRVRTNFRYGRSSGGDRYVRDVDVDIDVPEID